MKLALYRFAGITNLGVPVDDNLVDLTRGAKWLLESGGTPHAAALAAVLLPPTARGLLTGGRESLSLARPREVVSAVEQAGSADLRPAGILAPAAEVEFLPTLLGSERFICVGRNYLEHRLEKRVTGEAQADAQQPSALAGGSLTGAASR